MRHLDCFSSPYMRRRFPPATSLRALRHNCKWGEGQEKSCTGETSQWWHKPCSFRGRLVRNKSDVPTKGWKGVSMNRKHFSWSVILLAGTCVGVAPAWSAGSSSTSSSDQSQQGSMRQSSGSSSTDSDNATGSSTSGAMHRRSSSHMSSQGNVKQAQEALKDKGFDPGPIDGVMGQKTQEALRSFQQSKNLKVTGRLDSETAQQLGLSGSSSGTTSSAGSSSRSNMGKSPGAPSSNMNTGTSDSPSSDTSQMPSGATRGSNSGSGH